MRVIITPLDVPPPIPAAVAAGIVAQPGGQAGATPLTARINIVSVIAPNTAVMLQVIGGYRQEVFARGGAALPIYPPENTKIEGQGLNVPVTLPDGDNATFTFDGTQTWLLSGGSSGGGSSISTGGTLDFSNPANSGLLGTL